MSSDIAYDFREQLEKAKPDEESVIAELKKIDQFSGFEHKTGKNDKADAYDQAREEWMEIKVDYTDFPNHFVERFSSLEERKPGGPWQYHERDVKYYVFYYKNSGDIYVFETKKLIEEMENLMKKRIISDKTNGSRVNQKNADYHTYGYKVKKELLDGICFKKIVVGQTC